MIQPRASSTSCPSPSTSDRRELADGTPVDESGASAERSATDDHVRIEVMMDAHVVDALRSVLAGRDGTVEELARNLLRQAYHQMASGDGAPSDAAPVATPSPRSACGETEGPERPSDGTGSMSPATAMRHLHRAVRAAQEAADPLQDRSHHGDGERFDPPPEVSGGLIENANSKKASDEDTTGQSPCDPDQSTLPAFVLDILSRLGEDGALDDAATNLTDGEPGDAESGPSGARTGDADGSDASMFDVVQDDQSLKSHREGKASPSGNDARTEGASANNSSPPAPTIQLPRASLLRRTYRA